METREREAWLALAAIEGVGGATLTRLIARYGGAAGVLDAARAGRLARPVSQGGEGGRLDAEVVARVEATARDPRPAIDALARLDLWTLTPLDPGYPSRFDVLGLPPPVLYGWGDVAALEPDFAVAVVGTRRPTPFGRAFAARLTRHLVDGSALIVSGLAIGIDGAAHAATLEAGGRTVAFIGASHEQPGPRAHRALVRGILEGGGAVVSELAPGKPSGKGMFPRRNRLLAALADAVLVVEAPAKSGAINTAHHALELGRPLFVAPGRPGDPSTAGCLRLLRETPARPLIGVGELDEDLAALGIGRAAADVGARVGAAAAVNSTVGLGEVERTVARLIARAPGSLETITAGTGLPPAAVAGAVTLLQLRGLVRLVDGALLPTALLDPG
ncbi:MAG: DNA-processing protein DprA [Candidatus Limnocylindrales bacterium]